MIRTQLSNTLLTKILTLIGGLIQGIFVTRLLGAEGKGLFSYFQANVGFLTLALGVALPTAITYFAANQRIAVHKLLGIGYAAAFGALLIVAGFVALNMRANGFEFFLPHEAKTNFFAVYFCLSFFCFFINGIYTQIFAGRARFAFVNRVEFMFSLARVLVFGGIFVARALVPAMKVSLDDLSLRPTLFAADLAFSVGTFVIYYVATRVLLKEKADFNLRWARDLKPVFNFIYPLYLAALMAFLYNRCDLWIIEHFRGLREFGLYSVAAGGAQLLLFFPTAINSVLYTYLTKAQHESRLDIFSKISKANLLVVGLAGSCLFMMAGWLVPAFYGVEFSEAVTPLRILVVANFMVSIKFLFILFNQITENLKENILSELIVGLISIALNLKFIPIYGLRAASYTLLLSHTLALGFLLLMFRRRQKVRLNEYLIPTLHDINGYGLFAWQQGLVLLAATVGQSSKIFKRPRPPK